MPDQLVNKSVQQGFVFNIMCIGETGLGKSTLMDTLFNTNFESQPSPHSLPNVNLKSNTYELQESNVKLKVSTGIETEAGHSFTPPVFQESNIVATGNVNNIVRGK